MSPFAKIPMTDRQSHRLHVILHRGFFTIVFLPRPPEWRTVSESVGQSLSALGASSLENVATISGLHSLSEAMLLLSLTLFRLVSSEHSGFPPYKICCRMRLGSAGLTRQMMVGSPRVCGGSFAAANGTFPSFRAQRIRRTMTMTVIL